MDKPKTTPKDFFVWAGAMVALYVSVFTFISLLFDYINYSFPDPLSYLPEPYESAIPWEIAALVVLFPVAITLMQLIRSDIAHTPEKKELWVRRWFIMLTVFVAGATVIIDLIVLLTNFLGGDFTTKFLLKVLVVFLVAGGSFLHFLAEIRGYWDTERTKSQIIAAAAGVAVLVAIGVGFYFTGAPWNIRLFRFDTTKVNNLQDISNQVANYWSLKQHLPVKLSDLNDPATGYVQVPSDPQTGQMYEYKVMGATSYSLCATFNAEAQTYASQLRSVPVKPIGIDGTYAEDNWNHGAGHVCFTRTIDPDRYPPFKK